jgi:tetratricopeptide (TPR) repeat protein
MRHIRIRLVCLFAGALSALTLRAQEMTPQAQALAVRAVQLQTAGQFAEAATVYTELLQLVPNDVTTHVNFGVVLVNLGRFDEAIQQYSRAEELLPGDRRIQLNKALAYEKSGQLSEAEKQFAALHQADPAEPKYTVLLADCESQLGHDDEVIALLQPLQTGAEMDRAIAYLLGTALLHKGKIEEGERVLDPLLRNGNTAEAHFLFGVKAFESNDYPGAVKELGSAVELNSKLPLLQSFYGRALLNTGDPEGAMGAFRKELTANPNDFWSNLQLGQILVVRKQFMEAAPLLKHALLLRPQSAEASLAYAEALAGQGDLKQARPYAEAAALQLPQSAEVHGTLQTIYTGLHLATLAKHERELGAKLARKDEQNGPNVNELAPDFTLASEHAGKEIRLSSFRGKSPIVLIFGSYSCPNFRSAADALKAMGERYGSVAPFFLVYIREAHATDQWLSTRNQRDGVSLAPAKTYVEKQEYATMCSRKLHLPFPALVDTMNGLVENSYHAWPSRAFIVGVDGKILYSTRLTELDFRPMEMERVLKRLAPRTGSISKLDHR